MKLMSSYTAITLCPVRPDYDTTTKKKATYTSEDLLFFFLGGCAGGVSSRLL